MCLELLAMVSIRHVLGGKNMLIIVTTQRSVIFTALTAPILSFQCFSRAITLLQHLVLPAFENTPLWTQRGSQGLPFGRLLQWLPSRKNWLRQHDIFRQRNVADIDLMHSGINYCGTTVESTTYHNHKINNCFKRWCIVSGNPYFIHFILFKKIICII